ncbi:MAG: GNAT family N-acetyltransferase [Lachnospiraceae bacterium]|nr:GNAT family N-acetyltransferase [Lachnospiraceae bacterium]
MEKSMVAPDKELRIYGNEVYIRPITVEDTDMVLGWRNSKRTVENFFYRKPISREEHLDWIENKVNKGLVHQFVVCSIKDDTPMGVVYLQHFDENANKMESGVFMSENAPSGRGIATEAVKLLVYDYGFKVLGLHKQFARVLGSNEASKRLHIKAGFKEEGYATDDMFLDGKYVDVVTYGVINPEEK